MGLMRAIFCIFNKEIAYNLRTTYQILMQFYTVTYLSRFCDWRILKPKVTNYLVWARQKTGSTHRVMT